MVCLEPGIVVREPVEEERHESKVLSCREVGKRAMKRLRIRIAEVRRQAHAYQHHRCALGADTVDDVCKILAHASRRKPTQAVICPELQDHDGRMVSAQQRIDASAATVRGFATDAGVDDRVGQAALPESLFQEGNPAAAAGQAVFRG